MVNLVVLASLLRATTKRGRQLFEEEKCTPRENPGYTYVINSVYVYDVCGSSVCAFD